MRHQLRRNPDTLRGPDIAWLSQERLRTVDPDKIFEGAPNLAVEVASPSDPISALLKKTFQYLEAGAEEVWLILPVGEVLQSSLLPGFALSVGDVFV